MAQLEDHFCPDLFVNTDYTLKTFKIGDIQQKLFCLEAASTDHDLTGQVVWPVSILVSWYVVAHKELFAGKRVLEVGSGTGLCGFIASQFADQCFLTDGNEIVMQLLRDNIIANSNPEKCEAHQLRWGCEEDIKRFQEICNSQLDIIVGADVICWPRYIELLLATVKHLMLRSSKPFQVPFICGFVCRAQQTKDLLLQHTRAMGFCIEEIQPSTFLPEPAPSNIDSLQKLQLFIFRLDAAAEEALRFPRFPDKLVDMIPGPC